MREAATKTREIATETMMFESIKSVFKLPALAVKKIHFRMLRRGKTVAAAFLATLPHFFCAFFTLLAAVSWQVDGVRTDWLVSIKLFSAVFFIGVWLLYWWMKYDLYKTKRI